MRAEDQILKEIGKRKSTIRRASYLEVLKRAKEGGERERERERERKEKKRKEISTNVFVKTKRTLQLIGNGRTMNKRKKMFDV